MDRSPLPVDPATPEAVRALRAAITATLGDLDSGSLDLHTPGSLRSVLHSFLTVVWPVRDVLQASASADRNGQLALVWGLVRNAFTHGIDGDALATREALVAAQVALDLVPERLAPSPPSGPG
ncbi:hypothetical protein AB0A74_01490 [Saccharothrix sp. NPDC042600]|uniref:hypothetical protein n=1 Tax=Saccharothrix sp. NPDC042600 TaxID=3154492 RepID=UPI0033EC459A